MFGGDICNEDKIKQGKKKRIVDEQWSFCNEVPGSPYQQEHNYQIPERSEGIVITIWRRTFQTEGLENAKAQS